MSNQHHAEQLGNFQSNIHFSPEMGNCPQNHIINVWPLVVRECLESKKFPAGSPLYYWAGSDMMVVVGAGLLAGRRQTEIVQGGLPTSPPLQLVD